jgi:hypothetical protein
MRMIWSILTPFHFQYQAVSLRGQQTFRVKITFPAVVDILKLPHRVFHQEQKSIPRIIQAFGDRL